MTNEQLTRLIDGHHHHLGKPTVRALKLVLIEKRTWKDAAETAGVAQSTISRAIKALGIVTRPTTEVAPSTHCPHCGRPYH